MIRVVRPAKPPPILEDRGRAERDRLCEEFDAAPADYTSGKKSLAINRDIYADAAVKTALCNAQHGKCAFCESKVSAIAYGDVDHFRPKAGYQQRRTGKLKKPGYYWLAYEWSNLLFACQICNQQGKKNLFPLAKPRNRAVSHHDDLTREEPLLIDPSEVAPERHVGFREEVAFPRDSSRMGKVTIDLLGLNRPALIEKRRDYLAPLKVLVVFRNCLQEEIAADGTSPPPDMVARLEEIDSRLAAARQDRAEFAAMARCLIP